ncbi:hypothetical protein ACIA8E_35515 [Streptomyces sp. NPDC051664]|uniref:hypothetical protein n=1 Tax=Streptomyces sp. NPDC051664 TaxID=3365668 RepID=UPI0037B11DEF
MTRGGRRTRPGLPPRVLLALAFDPEDAGRPAVADGRFIDCGRGEGYTQARLQELHRLAEDAQARGAWVYSSYDPKRVGWDVYVGTSEASPLFAGIVALADQVAGHRLGDIHQALYAQSSRNTSTGIVDVKGGTNNSYAGVTGYTAVKGYDMATGVGMIDATRFVPAFAKEG